MRYRNGSPLCDYKRKLLLSCKKTYPICKKRKNSATLRIVTCGSSLSTQELGIVSTYSYMCNEAQQIADPNSETWGPKPPGIIRYDNELWKLVVKC